MTTPPFSSAASEERLREVLLALYRHPLTSEQLLRLNPTYSFPFPVHQVTRNFAGSRRTYSEARTLTRLLQRASADGLIQQAQYAVAGRSQRPYYLLTEAGYSKLFPGQPVPKKSYLSSASHERRSRVSPFFRPIPLNTQEHDYAVSQSVVHTLIQAKRDQIRIDAYHTRNRMELKIPTVHALGTALKDAVRLNPETGEPIREHLALYPDATVELVNVDGSRFLRFDEIDGGSESVLSREDIDAIERKVRFYDHYADISSRRFRVRLMTYRQNSFGRLQSVIECVRSVLRDPRRPLFLFTTLDRYLETNGALTRACFLDHFEEPVPCVRSSSSGNVSRLPARARGMVPVPRPKPRDRANGAADPNLSTFAAAAS